MYDLLKSFVEGRADLKKIQSFFLENQDAAVLMREAPYISPYTGASVDGFEYLIGLNEKNNDDLLDAQDFLGQILEIAGVEYNETDRCKKIADIKYKSQPKWVDVDPGVLCEIIDAAEAAGRAGKSLIFFAKEEIMKRYSFVDKPPKWIQNPEWPLKGGIPLKFISQEKNGARHDVAYDYKFVDQKTGEVTVVTQAA